MATRRDSDFYWWILGGVQIAAGATAAIVSTLPAAPRSAEPLVAAVPKEPMTLPDAPALPESTPTAPLVVKADPAPPPDPPQIWQCERNGQKVFSDSRCGADAAPMELHNVNRMDAAPAAARPVYDYGYAPRAPDASDASDGPNYPSNYADPIYTGPVVINPRLARARFPRPRPQAHDAHEGHAAPHRN